MRRRQIAELACLGSAAAVWSYVGWDSALWDPRYQLALHLAAVAAIVGLGVLAQLSSILGVIFMPNLMDRLHYLSLGASLGPALIAGAVVTKEALNHQGIFAVLIVRPQGFFGHVARESL